MLLFLCCCVLYSLIVHTFACCAHGFTHATTTHLAHTPTHRARAPRTALRMPAATPQAFTCDRWCYGVTHLLLLLIYGGGGGECCSRTHLQCCDDDCAPFYTFTATHCLRFATPLHVVRRYLACYLYAPGLLHPCAPATTQLLLLNHLFIYYTHFEITVFITCKSFVHVVDYDLLRSPHVTHTVYTHHTGCYGYTPHVYVTHTPPHTPPHHGCPPLLIDVLLRCDVTHICCCYVTTHTFTRCCC